MIRVLIVEDEPLARRKIRAFLKAHADFEVAGECVGGREAAAQIVEQRPDLVFLDVRIPEMDGFQVLQTIQPGLVPEVIFVTAYDQYAVKAFEVHALDYLLKPFSRRRFDAALERARERLLKKKESSRGRFLEWLRRQDAGRLVVKSNGRVLLLDPDRVEWIEAQGDYVMLHAGKDNHLIRETMHALESRLDPRRFVRIHRSTIVNLSFVNELKPVWSGDYKIVLRNGTELTLSRTFRHRLGEVTRRSGPSTARRDRSAGKGQT